MDRTLRPARRSHSFRSNRSASLPDDGGPDTGTGRSRTTSRTSKF